MISYLLRPNSDWHPASYLFWNFCRAGRLRIEESCTYGSNGVSGIELAKGSAALQLTDSARKLYPEAPPTATGLMPDALQCIGGSAIPGT
jgi:hypothetical protein